MYLTVSANHLLSPILTQNKNGPTVNPGLGRYRYKDPHIRCGDIFLCWPSAWQSVVILHALFVRIAFTLGTGV